MDDLTAFERQIGDELRREIGPAPHFDVASIVHSVVTTAPRERRSVVTRLRGRISRTPTEGGFTMFSALKIVLAAAIVALFGGFLLAGVLTTPQGDEMAPAAVTESPSPMTTEALLLSMNTEVVQPGVYRVTNDGVRDLVSADIQGIAAGYDGNIWLLLEGEFLRLGSEEAHGWPTVFGPRGRDLEVGPDGTFWTIPNPSLGDGWTESTGNDVFRTADGEEWSVMPRPDDCTGVTIAPDGRAWASCPDGTGTWRVAHLGPQSWHPLDGSVPIHSSPPDGFYRLTVTDSGDIYGVAAGWGDILYRYEDGTWRQIGADFIMPARVGPDGTAWGIVGDRWNRGLARLVDGEWSSWTQDELPEMAWSPGDDVGLGIGFGLDDGFQVAPDGSLWARLWRGGVGIEVESVDPDASMVDWGQRFEAVMDGRAACDGVVRFDGLTTDHFLPGRCVRWDFATDGSVWVLADNPEGKDLHVITHEAIGGQP